MSTNDHSAYYTKLFPQSTYRKTTQSLNGDGASATLDTSLPKVSLKTKAAKTELKSQIGSLYADIARKVLSADKLESVAHDGFLESISKELSL